MRSSRPPPPADSALPSHGCGARADLVGSAESEPARQRLLLAGLHLFAEQGYAKTSIRQIAVRAGTNVAAISYYFGNKAGLYRTVYWGGDGPPAQAEAALPPPEAHSLDELFRHILEPLRSGKPARSWIKLQRREMLEPTGLWQQKVDRGLMPMHANLVAQLCRRLGLEQADDEVRALALLVIGPAVHLLVNCEIVDLLAPGLLDGTDAVDAWLERLSRSAEAVIEAERQRRVATGRAPAARPSSTRIPRSKA